MLLQLTPEQISRRWNDISAAFMQCLPPDIPPTDEVMNNILRSLIDGSAQCWAGVGSINGKMVVCGLMLTKIEVEYVTGTRSLYIFTLYAYNHISDQLYLEGMETVRKFAKANNCSKVTALTSSGRVVDIAKQLGGKADYTLVTLEV